MTRSRSASSPTARAPSGCLNDDARRGRAARCSSAAAARRDETVGRRQGVSIAGQPIHLVFGCADDATGSALSEARRLVEQVGVDILIGPTRSDEGLAIHDYARRQPAHRLRQRDRRPRSRSTRLRTSSVSTDGAQWTAGLGAYAYQTLGWRNGVTVVGDDAFN